MWIHTFFVYLNVLSLTQKELQKHDSFSQFFYIVLLDSNALGPMMLKDCNPITEEGDILVLQISSTANMTSSFPTKMFSHGSFWMRLRTFWRTLVHTQTHICRHVCKNTYTNTEQSERGAKRNPMLFSHYQMAITAN